MPITRAQLASRRRVRIPVRDLERLGLATPTEGNRWKVASDLLQRLEQQPRPAPERHRLLLKKEPLNLASQVRHPGPVWLDRLRRRGLAPYGFGAQLQRMVTDRRDALREIGIQPGDPNRMAKLSNLEVRSVAKVVADRSGQTFLPTPPPNFQGRVDLTDRTPSGRAYAVVSDGSRFALVRATPSVRRVQGQQIAMTRDLKDRPRRPNPF
jgi:Protein of unknown function (DUF3363)